MRCTLAALLAIAVAAEPATAQPVVFSGVNVVTTDGRGVLENQSVGISDGVITAIGPAAQTAAPPGATVVDGDGRYLMPGLADMHVHPRVAGEYISYLAHGVTTIMVLGSSNDRARQIREDRDAIERSELLGPNIITTAQILDGSPPTGGSSALRSLESADEAAVAVRELAEADFDVVKIYNNVPRDVFDAIVAEAATQNLPVVGHVPRNIDPAHSLANRLDVVAHAEEFFFTVFSGPRSTASIDRSWRPDAALIPGLVEALVESDVWVIPNMAYLFSNHIMWDGLHHVWNDPEMAYLAPATARQWRGRNLNRRDNIENFIYRDALKYALMQELVRQFAAGNVRMLLGTDAPIEATFPGKSAHRELRELVKVGLTNEQALAIGTRNAGDFAREHLGGGADAGRAANHEQFGRVSVGYRADLVLLDANPLEDIRNVDDIAGVMVRGRWLDRAALDARRAELADGYAQFNAVADTLRIALEEERLETTAGALQTRHARDEAVVAEIERVLNGLGYTFVGAGELDQARDIFEVNTRLFPASANVWDSLAETYLALGNRERAIELYRKALEVDPGFESARLQLERIN